MAIIVDPKGTSASIKIVPLVTLREGVIFPHTDAILSFGRQSSIEGVNRAADNDGLICFVSQKDPRQDNPAPEDLYTVGTICKIERTVPVNNEIHAIVHGISRVQIHQIDTKDNTLTATVSEFPDKVAESDELKALINHLISQVKRAVNLGKSDIEVPAFLRIVNSSAPDVVTDQVASILKLKNEDKQTLLEQVDLIDRIKKVIDLLEQEIKVLELEQKIASKTQKRFDQSMKEAVLRERMKTIQKELGESEEDTEVSELKKKLKDAKLPPEQNRKAVKELSRLAKLSIHNPEASYIRSWLETVVEIPWSKSGQAKVSLSKADRVLRKDHYGLKDVKERILEYLAVMQLRTKNGVRGKSKDQVLTPTIICFVGPPGVGKTSVGRSIAKALGRKFVRMALGGIRDEAEIRGHRRTYVGAMPGRVVQALIDAGTNNPVIMLDEIDKIGADYRGDPSSALLEVLDPEQNKTFVDHYVDMPLDLSKVLFITTANVLDTIPPALQDRLEIIRFSGYTEDEKLNIAIEHLIDKQLKTNALTSDDVVIPTPTLEDIIKFYTREAGVRNLEREIAKVYRKVARKIALDKVANRPVEITPAILSRYLGPRRFTHSIAEEKDEVGISTGLAYTQVGGDILFIEVALMEGKGQIILTGQLGNVMKESARAAFSYVRSRARQFGLDPKQLAKTDVHIHVPEGAVPKDGPSAGAAITTALVSAFTKRPVNRLVGMTGEVNLRGRVTEIGGVKEKVIAGHRAGLKEIVLPKDNKKDMVNVPSRIKKDLKFHYAATMDDVLKLVLN